MGKERNYNPVQAQHKKEKTKQKQRAKETLRNSYSTQNLQKDMRAAEQELVQFLTSNKDIKLANSTAFQSKLGQVNDVRIKLELQPKTPDDYALQFKEIKRQLKSLKKESEAFTEVAKNTALGPSTARTVLDEEEVEDHSFDQRDMSGIKIPSGTAPETDGQIYNGLSQLRVVKCSKVLLRKRLEMAAFNQKKKSLPSPIPPPPPPLFDPAYGGALPMPTFLAGMLQMPFPPIIPSFADNYTMPPPPPPTTAYQNPYHGQSSRTADKGKLYATSSHAKAPANDPLAPEIVEAPERVQEQKSQLIYGSAPQMRDFKKEVTGFIPAALLRKRK